MVVAQQNLEEIQRSVNKSAAKEDIHMMIDRQSLKNPRSFELINCHKACIIDSVDGNLKWYGDSGARTREFNNPVYL